MLQPLILAAFLLVVAFLQPAYPSLENLPPITVQNATSLTQVAAIGSDTLVQTLWSPDGKILAAVTSGQVILYKVDDLKTAIRTIPHRADEKVAFEANGHLKIGRTIWDIQIGASKTYPSEYYQRSPSGHLEVTTTSDGKQTLVTITDSRRTKPIQLKTGTASKLVQIVFSPDEKFAVLKFNATPDYISGVDAAELWNIDAGTLVTPLDQVLEHIQQIEFSANGALLTTTTYTNDAYSSIFQDIRVWDGHTGNRLDTHTTIVSLPVDFSPDKQLMVYATYAGLSLWSDHEIGYLGVNSTDSSFLNPHFSPDGKSLLAVGNDGIVIWDIDTAIHLGKPRLLIDHKYGVDDFAFNEDGTRLIVFTDDRGEKRVRIWDFTQQPPKLLQVVNDLVTAEMSPDLTRIWGNSSWNASANWMLFDATNGQRLFTFPSNARINSTWNYVTYQSEQDQTIFVVDLTTGKITNLNPLPDYLGTAHFFNVKAGEVLFTLPYPSNQPDLIQAYDLQSGENLFTLKDNVLNSYVLTKDGQLLIVDNTAVTSSTVSVHDTSQTDKSHFNLSVPTKDAQFFLLPNQDKLVYLAPAFDVTGKNSEQQIYTHLELWNTLSPRQLDADWTIQGSVQQYGLNSAGNLLALATFDNATSPAINLLDLDQSQSEIRSFELPTHNYPAYDRVQFSPNDAYLALSLDDQDFGDGIAHDYWIFLYATDQFNGRKSGDTVEPFRIPSLASPLFSPDSQFLLAYEPVNEYGYAIEHQFHLWGLKDKVELSAFRGDGIAAFSSDSALLAIHNGTNTEVYSTKALASGNVKPLITLPDNEGEVKDLAFSADGKRLYLVEEARVRVYGVQ